MPNLTATIFECSLKSKKNESLTWHLSTLVQKEFKKNQIKCDIIRLVELDIAPGNSFKPSRPDQSMTLYEKIMDTDIMIVATPIWWGQNSSLAQSLIEHMDAIDDWRIDNKFYPLINKTWGNLITGGGDGEQSIISRLNGFATELGFTSPPSNYVSYLGDHDVKKMTKSVQDKLGFFIKSQKYCCEFLTENNLSKAIQGE